MLSAHLICRFIGQNTIFIDAFLYYVQKIIYFCKHASKPTQNMVLKLTGLAEAPLKDLERMIQVNTSNNVFQRRKFPGICNLGLWEIFHILGSFLLFFLISWGKCLYLYFMLYI